MAATMSETGILETSNNVCPLTLMATNSYSTQLDCSTRYHSTVIRHPDSTRAWSATQLRFPTPKLETAPARPQAIA